MLRRCRVDEEGKDIGGGEGGAHSDDGHGFKWTTSVALTLPRARPQALGIELLACTLQLTEMFGRAFYLFLRLRTRFACTLIRESLEVDGPGVERETNLCCPSIPHNLVHSNMGGVSCIRSVPPGPPTGSVQGSLRSVSRKIPNLA